MSHDVSLLMRVGVICGIAWLPTSALSVPVAGSVDITSQQGQFLGLKALIDDSTTRFELTGPDFSWFAFGFDTRTMFGYSLIIEGTDTARTAVEQNLRGIGDPGVPQAMQNIRIVDVLHDGANDLTTIVLERASHTGDPDDPDFTTSMTSLDLIWAYDAFASPGSPRPDLAYHGSGRGFATIAFAPIPEPASAALLALGVGTMIVCSTVKRRRIRRLTR